MKYSHLPLYFPFVPVTFYRAGFLPFIPETKMQNTEISDNRASNRLVLRLAGGAADREAKLEFARRKLSLFKEKKLQKLKSTENLVDNSELLDTFYVGASDAVPQSVAVSPTRTSIDQPKSPQLAYTSDKISSPNPATDRLASPTIVAATTYQKHPSLPPAASPTFSYQKSPTVNPTIPQILLSPLRAISSPARSPIIFDSPPVFPHEVNQPPPPPVNKPEIVERPPGLFHDTTVPPLVVSSVLNAPLSQPLLMQQSFPLSVSHEQAGAYVSASHDQPASYPAPGYTQYPRASFQQIQQPFAYTSAQVHPPNAASVNIPAAFCPLPITRNGHFRIVCGAGADALQGTNAAKYYPVSDVFAAE
jgi:hypothetical protein